MIVFIEGNIGAGKTTLCNHLEGRGFTVIREPVNRWAFLAKRYADPRRWTFTFQIEAMATMALASKSAAPGLVFIERSVDSTVLFAEVAHEAGDMDASELALIKSLRSVLPTPSSVTVCIDTDTDTCLERCRIRNRDGETVTRDYLDKIARAHQNRPGWLYIDGNGTPEEVMAMVIDSVCGDI